MTTTPTFIPGYLAEIEINLVDFTIVGNVLSLDFAPTVLPKPVFGQQYANAIGGQITATLSASGHLSTEILPSLLPLIESNTSVDFTITIGEAGGTIDGGTFSGKLVASGLSITDDATGEWEWSFDGTTDGPITYTAPTP